MEINALISNARDAYAVGLQKQSATQAAALQKLSGKTGGDPEQQKKQVREAAQNFESFFISQMMEQMMAGIETDPMFGGGHGEDMWRSMLNQEYGKEVAKSGRLGIADHVMKGMLLAQEQRTAAQTGQPVVVTKPETDKTDVSGNVQAAPVFMPIRR